MNIRRFWKWRYIVPAAVVLGPVAVVAVAALAGWIVMLLWNWLLPPLFGWREVTFWQAVGILALSRILFGGLGIGGGGRSRRWDRNMSPEERARFRQRMRDRCGMGPETPETPAPPLN